MNEILSPFKERETVMRRCGHWCRSGMCDDLTFNGKCHCGGCVNEANRLGLALAPNNDFGYASR